jgi:hypothetical protein
MLGNARLGFVAKDGREGRTCQPCRLGFPWDAGTVFPACRPTIDEASGAVGLVVTAHLIGKRGDVDWLAEETGETRRPQPIVISCVG